MYIKLELEFVYYYILADSVSAVTYLFFGGSTLHNKNKI